MLIDWILKWQWDEWSYLRTASSNKPCTQLFKVLAECIKRYMESSCSLTPPPVQTWNVSLRHAEPANCPPLLTSPWRILTCGNLPPNTAVSTGSKIQVCFTKLWIMKMNSRWIVVCLDFRYLFIYSFYLFILNIWFSFITANIKSKIEYIVQQCK